MEVLKFKTEPFSKTCIPIVTRTCIMAYFTGIETLYKFSNASLPPRNEAEGAVTALVEALKHGAVYHWTPVSLLARKKIVS